MEEKRKIRTGRVVSNKMNKTVVVAVETTKRHPRYMKIVKKITNYKAHDENNACKVGDLVKLIETRPLSKEKRWRITEVVAKSKLTEVQPQEIA